MKEARIGRPITLGETTIIPLERVSLYYDSRKGGLSAYLSKEPIGIVIGSPQGKWAMDICGAPIPLESYVQEIRGLGKVLDSL